MKLNSGLRRNNNIDVLKAVCAFMIVAIHFPFPGEIGKYAVSIARIAVPVFLIISGYFYSSRTIKHQMKKVLVLAVFSNLFYMFVALVSGNLDVSLLKIIKFILLNDSPFAGHLWYLNALLYVLVIVYVLDKLKIKKLLYYISPILLLCDLVFGKYSLAIFGMEFPFVLVRNFVFVGIPYYSIGMLLKNKNFKGNIIYIILFTATTILERYLLIANSLNASRDHYLSTTFLAVAVFCYVINKKPVKDNILSKIGLHYSTNIYILHVFIGNVMVNIVCKYMSMGLQKCISYSEPILIYIITAAVAALISYINSKIKAIYIHRKG